jgi:hypothetical protein
MQHRTSDGVLEDASGNEGYEALGCAMSRRSFVNAAILITGLAGAGALTAEAANAANGMAASGELPVRKPILTEQERGNLQTLALWARSWSLPDGSIDALLSDVYAKEAAILFPLQGHWLTGPSEDWETFRFLESAIARTMKSRAVTFKAIYPAHTLTAFEASIEAVWQDDTKSTYPLASIFQFDRDHRIVVDRTYNHLGRLFPADEAVARCSPI